MKQTLRHTLAALVLILAVFPAAVAADTALRPDRLSDVARQFPQSAAAPKTTEPALARLPVNPAAYPASLLNHERVAEPEMINTKPFNLSLTPHIAVFSRHETITGITISIWGENEQHSLALGIVNGSTGDSGGLAVGVLNYAANYRGLQWGVINYAGGDVSGWQGGWVFGIVGSVVNYAGGDMSGLQSGLANYANRLSGLQFGVINIARTTDAGLQIGLVNLISANDEWFSELPDEFAPAMVLVNWRF